MSKLINEAYSAIKDAPLRYYIEACSVAYGTKRQSAERAPNPRSKTGTEALPKTDRLEFWIRFVCGASLGTLLSFRFLLFYYDQPGVLIFPVVIVLGFGFIAARYGDQFWHSFFRHWWIWW